MAGENGSVKIKTMTKRAEIDTTAPFRSVKEAVMLFGEKVLAGELYANKPKDQMESDENGNDPSILTTITTELELEETKECLQKAREESMLMAHCLSALQEELEQTKRELEQMKERESEKKIIITDPIKEFEYEERSNELNVKTRLMNEGFEFQKKRYVTFANPPSLARVMVPQGDDLARLERHPSLRKAKKKPLIPLIGGIFSKKKGRGEVV